MTGRPEYRKMMEGRKKWDIVLAIKPDRVWRNDARMEDFIETIRVEGKQFWTVEGGRRDEYKGAFADMARKITDSQIPQAESEQLSQRILPNLEEAKDSKIHTGRPPIGLIWNRLTKSFEASAWARRIEKAYNESKSALGDAAAKVEAGRLNPYPAGSKFKGRPVSLTTVDRILSNLKGRDPNKERTPRGFWSKLQTPELYRPAEPGEQRLADYFKAMTLDQWTAYCIKRARMKNLGPPGVPCPRNKDAKDRDWKCFFWAGGKRSINPKPPIKVAHSFRTTGDRDRHVKREHPEEA